MIAALAVAAYRYARERITGIPQADRWDDIKLRGMLHRTYDDLAMDAYDAGDPVEAWRLAGIAHSYTAPLPE